MKTKPLNFKRLLQLAVLAVFLFSLSTAANATILCQCEEGHITVENIDTGYCDTDFNHDHSAPGHCDITCDCEDTAIYMGTISIAEKIDFDFSHQETILKTDREYGAVALNQNHISYILNRNRRPYNSANRLSTIILII